MERSRKVLFVSHCILNQNVKPKGKEVYPGSVEEILNFLSEADVGIVQIPCPSVEFFSDFERERKSKEYYDTPKYRAHCKKLAKIIIKQIENYIRSGYRVLGILGVELSPTCAVYQIENGNRISPGKGVLIEEIENEMRKKNFQVPIIGLNYNNIYATLEKLQTLIKYG